MIAWLRAYNDVHADKVQVAGAEYFMTSAPAYDAVDAFVATHEPERLDEVRSYLRTVRPTRSIGDHLQWYYYELSAEEKKPYMAAAAALHDVVEQVDAGRDTMALQHARQIHWWYEAYSLATEADISIYRDEKAARNVRWWARHTGDRTVYWAASAHVADAPRMTLAVDGVSAGSFASAGSFLERWYGAAYVPIGFTFDHGTYRTAWTGELVDLPPARGGWIEEPLADVRHEQFVLDLDRAPRQWLSAPALTRGAPDHGDRGTASGGTLGEWFDVVVHTQEVSPARRLG